jgi:hypothetical protein
MQVPLVKHTPAVHASTCSEQSQSCWQKGTDEDAEGEEEEEEDAPIEEDED